ncbi:hypothetical protein LOK46_24150 [Methylobacterium sp. NMS14P]|uniref:hypothetical protein n=1 Tax=unclassified Methylobacterium TaxID=2615210 RepID=UPI002358C7B1|nr:hypothetical protein [Methylobacterium sp. NMS14P]WCS24201.1 hypothetical protein LOK46_24150 [Methylobacterium sp. NMS14P]
MPVIETVAYNSSIPTTVLPRSARQLKRSGEDGRRVSCRREYPLVFKCAAAVLIALLVVAVGGLINLLLLPVRAIRGLFRHKAASAQVTAG